ncbi:MAG: hypothetical protein WDW38_001412 [Sanguina aurantia]
MRMLLPLLLALLSTASARDPEPKGLTTGTGHTVGFGELKEEWRGEVIHLSWAPRAFLLKGFLSDEECDHLVELARPHMLKSSVVDNASGKSVDSTIRTSTGTFLGKAQDEIVARIEKRVAQVSMIPIDHQEGFQILHYHDGQKYEPHFDYFHDSVNARPENGGQRVITILMYLSTVEEGGETVMPNADKKMSGPDWSECAQKGLSVKSYKGDALMFYSLKSDGSQDTSSLHGSCPTIKGDKWSATKWIHVAPFGPGTNLKKAPGDCSDDNDQCQEWSFFGECEKNPSFMNVTCRKACALCGSRKKVAQTDTTKL